LEGLPGVKRISVFVLSLLAGLLLYHFFLSKPKIKGVPKDTAFQNLKRITESIQTRGALLVIGGIDLPIGGRGFGVGYKTLSNETGAILIPNIFDGIMGDMSLMSDSIHPNDAGYTRMAEKFHEALKPYL
jgi:acyl-CoA thioesterase I